MKANKWFLLIALIFLLAIVAGAEPLAEPLALTDPSTTFVITPGGTSLGPTLYPPTLYLYSSILVQGLHDQLWTCSGTYCCALPPGKFDMKDSVCFASDAAADSYTSLLEVPITSLGGEPIPPTAPDSIPASRFCQTVKCKEIDDVWKMIRGILPKIGGKGVQVFAGGWVGEEYVTAPVVVPLDISVPIPPEAASPSSPDFLNVAGKYEQKYRLISDSFLSASTLTAVLLTTTATTICNEYKPRYQSVAQETGIPWPIIAVIHYREAGSHFNNVNDYFNKYLHNGQNLGTTTTITPVGIFFNDWDEAAKHAINTIFKGKLRVEDNDFLGAIEAYNGLAYRNSNRISPYLWSGTQYYTGGKYGSDGNYNSNLVDKQFGAAVLLKKMEDIGCISTANLVPIAGNLIISSGQYLNPVVLEALQRAVQQFNKPVEVSSGARTVKLQAEMFYNNCIQGGPKACAPITCDPTAGSVVDCNGGRCILKGSLSGKNYNRDRDVIISTLTRLGDANNCPHTRSYAIDIWCTGGEGDWKHDPFCQWELQKVLQDNNFCRLKVEGWHFEYIPLSVAYNNGLHCDKLNSPAFLVGRNWIDPTNGGCRLFNYDAKINQCVIN